MLLSLLWLARRMRPVPWGRYPVDTDTLTTEGFSPKVEAQLGTGLRFDVVSAAVLLVCGGGSIDPKTRAGQAPRAVPQGGASRALTEGSRL